MTEGDSKLWDTELWPSAELKSTSSGEQGRRVGWGEKQRLKKQRDGEIGTNINVNPRPEGIECTGLKPILQLYVSTAEPNTVGARRVPVTSRV